MSKGKELNLVNAAKFIEDKEECIIQRVKDLMDIRGVSQADIYWASNGTLNKTSISRMLSGERMPSMTFIYCTAMIFGVSADYILFGKKCECKK